MNYKEFLENVVKECKTKADFCRALDKKPTGGNYKTIDRIIKDYNLDTSHFKTEPWNKGICYRNPTRSLDEILVKNSPHLNTYSLKRRLLRSGLKESKCEICGITDSLELHHINGNSSDNRLENLQILCCNCHSKTNTHRGKKKKQGRFHKLPNERILSEEEVKTRNDARKLSKRLNISIVEAEKLILENPNKFITNSSVKRLEDKVCPICNKQFHPRNFNQIYCSKECVNKKQTKNIPSKEILLSKIVELDCNFTQIGKFFKVTDNAIRKWCKKYKIPAKKDDLKQYVQTLK